MVRILNYLTQCQVPTSKLGESESDTSVPPSGEETRTLIAYLRKHGVQPVIVGSVAIYHHLTIAAHKFRPTVDLDVFTHKTLPPPPPGWSRIKDSIGVESWESPSGGVVDFLQKNHQFPGGSKNPAKIEADPRSDADYPVAKVVDLLKLKLNSMRHKDLLDAVSLAKAAGLPSAAEFGALNATQKENLSTLRLWIDQLKNHEI